MKDLGDASFPAVFPRAICRGGAVESTGTALLFQEIEAHVVSRQGGSGVTGGNKDAVPVKSVGVGADGCRIQSDPSIPSGLRIGEFDPAGQARRASGFGRGRAVAGFLEAAEFSLPFKGLNSKPESGAIFWGNGKMPGEFGPGAGKGVFSTEPGEESSLERFDQRVGVQKGGSVR